ncbi:hypothetical protein BD413DRAFT_494958 [Trametes elegans]|nr:hypothetical protein BD413DRAFT_494958 [Trametes elegans]
MQSPPHLASPTPGAIVPRTALQEPQRAPESQDHINRLPAELLLEIFTLARAHARCCDCDCHVCSAPDLRAPAFQAPWARLTWVCARWRHVALANRKLWTALEIRTGEKHALRAAETFLARARGADLQLALRVGRRVLKFVSGACAGQVRVLEIAAAFRPGELMEEIRTFVEGGVGARLTELTLVKDRYRCGEEIALDIARLPNLRKLELRRVVLATAGLGSLRQLTHLTVEDVDHRTDMGMPALLAACPDLTFLTLRNSIAMFDSVGDARVPGILPLLHFPRLERLVVDSAGAELGPFLDSVRAPPTAAFDVVADYTWDSPMHYEWLLDDMLPQKFDWLPILKETRSIELNVGSAKLDRKIAIRGSSEPEFVDKQREWSIIVTRFDLDDAPVEALKQCCPTVWEALLNRFVPTKIVTLHLHVAPGLPVDTYDWARWLARFPHVQRLTVGGSPLAVQILAVLAEWVGLLPKLDSFELCFADLPEDESGQAIDPEKLASWLMKRAAIGAKPVSLSLRVPRPTTGATTALAQTLVEYALKAKAKPPVRAIWETCQTCHFVTEDDEEDGPIDDEVTMKDVTSV